MRSDKLFSHEGFSAGRLRPDQGNPREAAFAMQWKEEQRLGQILQHLVPQCTERDSQVAATVIQWLGSNVGMSFLEEVIRSTPQIQSYLEMRALRKAKG